MSDADGLDWLLSAAAGLPGVRIEDRQAWGCLILWVADRWFGMVIPDSRGEVLVNLKGDPDLNAALVGEHDWIIPAYHMNKKHWISLRLGHPDADRGLALDLLDASWHATVAGLPRRVARPLLLVREGALEGDE
ncbi:MAG TPA: MmcQ/YjbR family DNA-binding protein [Propionibacteriaceae bacterium]|nr:MmcQ/YjbR family DNA-binding protein [Propionibacteriaceae bacterium]